MRVLSLGTCSARCRLGRRHGRDQQVDIASRHRCVGVATCMCSRLFVMGQFCVMRMSALTLFSFSFCLWSCRPNTDDGTAAPSGRHVLRDIWPTNVLSFPVFFSDRRRQSHDLPPRLRSTRKPRNERSQRGSIPAVDAQATYTCRAMTCVIKVLVFL